MENLVLKGDFEEVSKLLGTLNDRNICLVVVLNHSLSNEQLNSLTSRNSSLILGNPINSNDVLADMSCMSKTFHIEQIVEEDLKKLGFPAHLKGYIAIKHLIIKMVEDEVWAKIAIDKITDVLYPTVAKELNQDNPKKEFTPTRVERAIRNSIERAFCLNKESFIDLIGEVHVQKGKPNNSFFIAEFYRYVNNQIKRI